MRSCPVSIKELCLHKMPAKNIFRCREEMPPYLSADEVIKRSARLIKTFALLDQIKARGEKVLVFVTNRKMQAILRHLLEKNSG